MQAEVHGSQDGDVGLAGPELQIGSRDRPAKTLWSTERITRETMQTLPGESRV
jgi:hypothetical protein